MLKRSVKVALLVACITLLGILLATNALAGDPPASGDWTVSDTTSITNEDITVQGNVTIASGGTLTLWNLTLLLDLPASGTFNIEVQVGGVLAMDGVVVDSADGTSMFNITIDGYATLANCTIRRMDGQAAPSPLSTASGLVLRNTEIYLHNSTIEACGGFAISVVPAGTQRTTPLLADLTVTGNGGGLYCGGIIVASGDPIVRNCDFYSNGAGEVLVIAANPRFESCQFGAQFVLGLTGVNVVANAKPVFVDCDFRWYASAFNSVLAAPSVKDCTISACIVGFNVLGGAGTITSTAINYCTISMVLNSTTVSVLECTISSFVTTTYAIQIDAGKPHIQDMELALTIIGGAISIVNGSKAQIDHCTFTGTGGSDVIVVEHAAPTLYWCTVQGGQDGIDLTWSPAWIERCTLQDNTGWGIIMRFSAATVLGNYYSTGIHQNEEGREVLLYSLRVDVEFENGTPAANVTVSVESSMRLINFEVLTGPDGLALDDLLMDYMVNNAGKKYIYTSYKLEAVLGDLYNRTYPKLRDNPEVTMVLRPRPNPPPTVVIEAPKDGQSYNVWQYQDLIPIRGMVFDKEEEAVNWSWWLDGEYLEETALHFDLELTIGDHQIMLEGRDGSDQVTKRYVNFTIVSVPPASNYVRILHPADGAPFDLGDVVALECEYRIRDHPAETDIPVLPVMWTSSIDGHLADGAAALVEDLGVGTHVITVTVEPRYPEYIPEPYNDTVTITVLAPDPVAVANISSPADGATFMMGDVVNLSAKGSYLEIWDPPDHRVVYSWSSDIDGTYPSNVLNSPHVITLELFTEPTLASDTAQVTVTILPRPNNLPHARISLLTARAVSGKEVNLSAAGSVDVDRDPLSYTWDLGDGNVSSGVNVTHVYSEEGNYTVTLRVSDGEAEVNINITVQVEPAPVVPPSNGGNGGNGGNGNGDDDGVRDPEDEALGWLVLILLLAALVSMLALALRRTHGKDV